MSVHKKLMAARVKLQSTEMKKSGLNKFAGYSYFELGDFIPHIQTIFNEIGLCGVVSFNTEYAQLCITDVDDGTVIVVTSPMAEANLKGAHPIQNLGAVESYQRRYLWMTAMEIVEHDIIDSAPAAEEKPAPKAVPKAEPKATGKPPAKIEGKDDKSWHLKVSADPGTDIEAWASLVTDVTKMGLAEAGSEADIMKLFTNNRVIFDKLKAEDEASYTALMLEFKTAKEKLKG
jgi:ERF superfamily